LVVPEEGHLVCPELKRQADGVRSMPGAEGAVRDGDTAEGLEER